MLRNYLKILSDIPADVRGLLVNQFLMNASEFTAAPIMAVYLAQERNLGPAAVGTILAMAMVTGHAVPTFTGAIVDRYGFRNIMVAGLLLRGAGLLAFPLLSDASALAVAALTLGVGAALYESAAYGVFGRQPAHRIGPVFVLNNQALNVGAVLGPLVGVLLSAFSTTMPLVISGVFFCVLGIACLRFESLDAHYPSRSAISASLLSIVKHRRFLIFLVSTLPWWFLFSQIFVTFPLHAVAITGDNRSASMVFLINGTTGVAFIWLSFLALKSMSPQIIMIYCYGLLAVAYAIVAFSGDIVWFYAAIALYTIAETLMLPSVELITSRSAPDGKQSTFFGGLGLTWGIGGSLGYYSGSFMTAGSGQWSHTWFLLSGIAIAGIAMAAIVHRSYGSIQSASVEDAGAA
jgi:MFS family permease